jgi:hypothetical protein
MASPEQSHVPGVAAAPRRNCAAIGPRSYGAAWALALFVSLGWLALSTEVSDAVDEEMPPMLAEEERYDFSNSIAEAVLIGTIIRLETVIDRDERGDRIHEVAHVLPLQWLRPLGMGAALIRVESTRSRLHEMLPMQAGQLVGPVRAILFLRAIPKGNPRLMRGLQWVFPAGGFGIRNGIKILDNQIDQERALAALSRSTLRLSPEGMASSADLIVSAERMPGGRECPPPIPSSPCVTFHVREVLLGSLDDSLITVYSDPPRSLPHAKTVLFLSRMATGHFKVLNSGHGAFSVSGDSLLALRMSLSELRSVVGAVKAR